MWMVCAAFLSLSAAEEAIMTGILNSKMINKQLELCAIGLCAVTCCHQQKCLLYALMCAAWDDSDYYCLQDEQLDAVSRFLVIFICRAFLSCPWRVTKRRKSFQDHVALFFSGWGSSMRCSTRCEEKTSVAGPPVNPDRLCVKRTKHLSWRAYHVFTRGWKC